MLYSTNIIMQSQTKKIDGHKIADQIKNQIKDKISQFDSSPCLAIILIGDDPGSHIYVGLKEKAAKQVGIKIKKYLFPKETEQKVIINLIKNLNSDQNINGILVQFPLPKHMDENQIIRELEPAKDVDGFHSDNIKCLLAGQDCLVPGLAEGIVRLLNTTDQDFSKSHVAVIGNSEVFTVPLEYLLTKKFKTVTILHADEVDDLQEYDVLVVAVGQPELIKGSAIKKGVIIIDVGYNLVGNKSVGDVDYESVKDKARWITPVPGGVGPMTVAMLLNNVVRAYEKQKSLHI